MLDAGGFGIDLAEEVAVDGVVDGNEVVDLRDDVNIVRVIDRRAHDVRVAVHVIIELLRTGGKREDLTALVELLVLAGDLAGHRHIHKAVHIHLGVNGEVLEVGLRDHRADGVRHTADAELQAGTVRDLRHDEVRHRGVDLGRRAARAELRHGRVLALNDHIDVGNVDLAAVQAVDPRQILVDLDDDRLGVIEHIRQMRAGQRIAEVAVLVHRRDLDHRHVHLGVAVAIEARQLAVAHGREIAHSLGDDLAVDAAAMPGMPGEVLAGVLRLADLGHPHRHAAADLDVAQLALTGGKRLVERVGMVRAPAVIDPVAALDGLDRLGGGGQLLLIEFLNVHRWSPPE